MMTETLTPADDLARLFSREGAPSHDEETEATVTSGWLAATVETSKRLHRLAAQLPESTSARDETAVN